MKRLTVAIMFSLVEACFFAAPSMAITPYTIAQLVTQNHEAYTSAINDSGQVVWSGYDELGEYSIYLFDPVAGITQLSNNGFENFDAQINDSGQVAWQALDGETYKIFLYDPVAGISQLGGDYNYYAGHIQINAAGRYVWEGADLELNWAIYHYDPVAGITRLTNFLDFAYSPQLNDSGQVVWVV